MADGAGALPTEVKQAIEKFEKTVEAFKNSNDERIKGVEKKFDDVVKKDEVDRINAAVSELKDAVNKEIVELKRAGAGGENARDERNGKIAAFEAKEIGAFDHYIRTGSEDGLKAAQAEGRALAKELGIEGKDLSTVINSDGGYMVHPEREAEMIEVLLNTSAMRQVARVTEIGTKELEIPVNKKGTTAAWTTELATRTRTATSEIELVKFGVDEIYALPLVTLSMLEDGEFDVEQWLHDEVVEAMDIAEEAAFVNGDGIKKPKGFLQYDKVANGSWSWGKVGYVVTGLSGGFAPAVPGSAVGPSAASNGYDAMISMAHAFNPRIRRAGNLDWAMRQSTLEEVRKIKDAQGNYIVRDPVTEDGIITQILGYPVLEFEDMPAIGADSYSIALGNWNLGYQILDRIGLQVRRDDITSPGNVIFHFRKRVGGGLRDYQAIKLLKFGTA